MATSINQKYIKQTEEALSHTNINLELIAMQISQMQVREQKKFFRLLINYIDVMADKGSVNTAMQDIKALCERLIDVVNDHQYELEQRQLSLF